MKKYILRNGVIFILCLITTFILFFYFVSDYIGRFMSASPTFYLCLEVFVTIVFYICTISVINRKVNKIHIDILSILYFILVIVLSFFKLTRNYNGVNLNPFTIFNDFKTYFHSTLLKVVGNSLIYLPLGVYIRYKIKASNNKLAIGFLFYILLIEIIQFISDRGIFDINDIILNTLGFVIGVYSYNLIHNLLLKQEVK